MKDAPDRRGPVQAVLARRARELARPVEPERRDLVDVLGFVVGGRRYALPLGAVREVVPGGPLCRVPQGPPALLGMMNVRGALLAVFHLAEHGVSGASGHPAWVIVLGEDPAPLALAAEEVTGVSRLDPRDLLAPPGASGHERAGLVRGVTPRGAVLLHADRLVADPRFWPNSATTAQLGTEER